MSVQSAYVTRRPLERSGWLSVALSLLAIMGNLPPPKAKSQKPRPHITWQYKTFFPRVRLMAGQSVEVYVKRVGGLSLALTQNIQIKGKSDSFPPRFDLTDYNDFDLSKTEKSLTVAGVSTNAQQITIQKRDGEVSKLGDRLDVIANATYGGTTFETRLKEEHLIEGKQTTVKLTYSDPYRVTAGGTGTANILDDTPALQSTNARYSMMSRHRTSTETLGDDGPPMVDHKITSGRLVIPADGGTTTLDVQTVEDVTPESELELLIAIHFEGHTPTTPKHRAANTFTSDSATKVVVVDIVDGDTPQPSKQLVYLCGGISGEQTDRPQTTLKEGENTELSVTRIGDAPLSVVSIPLKLKGLPPDKATSSNYWSLASVSIGNVQKSGSITLQTTDDSMDKGYKELPTIKLDDDSECWLSGNMKLGRSRFEIIMADNDKTQSNQLKLRAAALTEVADARRVTCLHQLTRRPKADPTKTTPFGSADNDEGIAGVNR